jgi:hypothetical protein
LSESSSEQTFNNEIFGTVLGYTQIGQTIEATLLPKASGPGARGAPDFVLGRFDPSAGIDEWTAVGEIKNAKTDLDQPQVGRTNPETPVEQGFRYATTAKPGVEWIIVTNFREVRLYKNGYARAYHFWYLDRFDDPEAFLEFYTLLRPAGLLNQGRLGTAARAFQATISTGRDLTEGFYGLYKVVQQRLITVLAKQPASRNLTITELYGKTHKLLNRVLFIAFCEDHPAELLPRNTLRHTIQRAERDRSEGSYWREFRNLFSALNTGGGMNGFALNAFNGGLFAHDAYFDSIEIPNLLFRTRFRVGRGRRQSREIVGIFGFDVYDFAEDLNEQALGAIFEQSLKDIPKGSARVRGFGEIEVTNQRVGGVYYTPREITAHLTQRVLQPLFSERLAEAERAAAASPRVKDGRGADRRRKALALSIYAEALSTLKIMDPACGSGAFLVEALANLHVEQERVNRSIAELRGAPQQRSLLDLDRLILQQNLFGRDLLPESVEISRLSIWLRTARRGERLEALNRTIVVGDSLCGGDAGEYDAVIGNPPWGADLEGWTEAEILNRFPDIGGEKDSYAIFVMRAWELLKPDGFLAFILPNSWLTVDVYTPFREWLLRNWTIIEIANTWKIFRDVNHDAVMLVARKRGRPIPNVAVVENTLRDAQIAIRALWRGCSEAEKLRQLAAGDWAIAHETGHRFQARQPNCRFEVNYPPPVSDELDQIAARCSRLDEVADVTVGIQVYHHTKVSKEFIRRRGFHSRARQGSDWYSFVEANDVQRYFIEPSTTQWLQFSDLLRDKRDLSHYRQPRILVQQIFWHGLCARFQAPTQPLLYLNTLFSIYNPRQGLSLWALLGILNSRFLSGCYERWANRLFGDKFPKVSKLDLARIPIPRLDSTMARTIGSTAETLQSCWEALRKDLREASAELMGIGSEARLLRIDEFWFLSEKQFRNRAQEVWGPFTPTQVAFVRRAYQLAKTAVDEHWPRISDAEASLEQLVRRAYRVSDRVYDTVIHRVPEPNVAWALRPLQ